MYIQYLAQTFVYETTYQFQQTGTILVYIIEWWGFKFLENLFF